MSKGSVGFTMEAALAAMRSSRACFVPNPGNAGDALIALGTFHAFRTAGLSIPLVTHDIVHQSDYDLVIYAGGGNLIPFYHEGLTTIQACAAAGKQVIVLPHSTYGYGAELIAIADNVRILCRETTSFKGLLADGFPPERLGISDDMAFYIDPKFFDEPRRNVGSGTAYCLRTDQESARAGPVPAENRDISLSWNGDLWHLEQFVASVCQSLAYYLSQFETVSTDRLHIAVLAGMLNRKVKFHDNSYYKNRSVFNYSIESRFAKVEMESNT